MAYVDSDGRSALLDLDHLDRPPVVLEGSAAEIWQRIDGVRDEEAIVADLVELYAEKPETIRPSVEQFLSDLAARDLVELVSDE